MKIGLALGGGGALGAAHLPLLEQIEKERIVLNEIAGSSAGAIIGLLFISGGCKNVENFLRQANSDLFNTKNILKSGNPNQFFKKLERLLRDYVKETHFYRLNIHFSVVATNFITGNMAVLRSGDPVNAVLASSAYPGVFPIQKIEDKYYIDGGVTRNVPTDVLKAHGNKFIIASSLNQKRKYQSKTFSRAITVTRSLDILQNEFESLQAANSDYLYNPNLHKYRWYRFDKIDDILTKSRKEANKNIKSISKAIKAKSKIFGVL